MYQLPEFQITLKTKVKNSELYTVRSSVDIADICRLCFDADNINWYESMVVIGLNKANKVLGFYKVSQGGLNSTVVDPRIILQFALLSNSCSIILCHNHPSGNLKASRQDEEVTIKIKTAVSYFDIQLLDHIIMTSEGYMSFADEGIL